MNWGKKKKMSRWAEPSQTPLAHRPHSKDPLPCPCLAHNPSLPHIPSPEGILPTFLHPLPKRVPFFAPSLVFSSWPGQPWGLIIPFRPSCPRKLHRKLPPQKSLRKSDAQSSVARVPMWMNSWIRRTQRSQRTWRRLPFQLIKRNQRGSQSPWGPLHSS